MGSPVPLGSKQAPREPQQAKPAKPAKPTRHATSILLWTILWTILFGIGVVLSILAWETWKMHAVDTEPVAPVPPTLINWALPDFGVEILPKSHLGERSNFLVQNWIRPTTQLYRLLDPTDPPELCMPTPVGSRMVLSLPKLVDVCKIIIKTKLGPVNTAVRAWDGVRLVGIETKYQDGVYEVNTTTSVLDLHFDGDGCVYGIEIWGV